MACQNLFQSGDQRQMLFAQSREIASDAAKGLSPRQAAKASRDFLLHFDHPDIAFGLTIVEWHPEIMQEAQHLVLVVEQAIQEIASGALWFSTAPGRSRVGLSRQVLVSGEHHALIAGSPLLQSVWRQAALSCGTSGLHGVLHLQQHGFHLSGPRLPHDLFDKGQLAQMMHIAQGVQALVALITGQAIMHADPGKSLEQPDGIQGFAPAVGMHGIMGQGGRAPDMHPEAIGPYRQAGFILMHHLPLLQCGGDRLFYRLQVLCAALDEGFERSYCPAGSNEILDRFARPSVRHELLLHQVDCQSPQRRTILHRSADALGKRGGADLLTGGAVFGLRLMLPDDQPFGGHIEHLTPFRLQHGLCAQIRLAVRTALDFMGDHQIGRLRQRQARALMSGLRSWLLPTFLAQRFGLRSKAIRRGGQVTVVALFGEPTLQLVHLATQLSDLLFERQQLCDQRVQRGIFFSKDSVFFLKSLEVVLHHTDTVSLSTQFRKRSQ